MGLQLDVAAATLQCNIGIRFLTPLRPSPKDLLMIAPIPFRTATVLAAVFLLAACATESAGPAGEEGGANAVGSALPPPTESTQSGGDLSTQRVEPVDVPAAGGAEVPADSEAVVFQGPDGTTWTVATPKNEAAYQDDVDDCYRYAVGQTRRDAQYLDDRNAGIDTLTNESRYSGLVRRVDEFDLRNRRTSLMSSCMESKGYARADTVLPRLEF
jgi:hypothetical protein